MWATQPQAAYLWPDSGVIDPGALALLLDAAQEQCEEYAPALADPAAVPARYTLAVVYQARELWAASQRGEQDVIGVGDYAIRARPLTAAVKALLRPQRGRPGVG